LKRDRVVLERALSKLGLASRSQARELIQAGKVKVAGRVITDLHWKIDPGTDRIAIDGISAMRAPWTLIALNKPRSVVTTRHDPEGRRTVYDLLTDIDARLVPVGRLDYASTGLLLFTNDTQLANWLTDPESSVIRRYVVTVRGELSDATATELERGVLDRREKLRAASVEVLKRSKRETHLIVELSEGRNREIRRMLKVAGHEVTRLKRIAFGGLALGELPPGKWRHVPLAEARAAFPAAPIHGNC
jgi:23S rRNA pseudouridine2605 synthase